MLYCSENEWIECSLTRDTCICFLAKNYLLKILCESNCCAKCTNLARGLVITLGSRMEWLSYYFLGTASYWVTPVIWKRADQYSFYICLVIGFNGCGFFIGHFGIYFWVVLKDQCSFTGHCLFQQPCCKLANSFLLMGKENNVPIKTFTTITKHTHFSWLFNVKLLNHVFMWTCTYQHTSFLCACLSVMLAVMVVIVLLFWSSMWMESSCNFMKLFLCMWVAVLCFVYITLHIGAINYLHLLLFSEMLWILWKMIWLSRWMSSRGKSIDVCSCWYRHGKLSLFLPQYTWKHKVEPAAEKLSSSQPSS